MEIQEAIRRRRTIRDFSQAAIPFSIIEKALQAGLTAPSYNHLKQWNFIFIRDAEIRLQLVAAEGRKEENPANLDQVLADYDPLVREMYLEAIPKQKKMILNAPELLVIVYQPKTQVKESQRVYDLNCLASVWCCIENILLSFAADNVFGVTFIPQNTPLVKGILHIPSQMEVAAFIPFGYPAEGAKIMPQKEVTLEERIHYNQW